MQNVSIMMVVTNVNVTMDSDQRQMKHTNHGVWHTDEIMTAALISMNAKKAHSMIVILKQRTVFEVKKMMMIVHQTSLTSVDALVLGHPNVFFVFYELYW